MSRKRKKDSAGFAARRAARGSAVQAVYQAIVTKVSPNRAAEEFLRYRIPMPGGSLLSGEKGWSPAAADRVLFRRLVAGVEERLSDIDRMIAENLRDDWPIDRQPPLLLAILRCSSVELLICPETPIPVIIDEYVEVAGGFFSEREPAFVNAFLDNLAKVLRPDETVLSASAGSISADAAPIDSVDSTQINSTTTHPASTDLPPAADEGGAGG